MKLTVLSYKGGVGKTTTSVHLAAYLSQRGKTVLLDADPNSSSLEWSELGKLPFEVRPLEDPGKLKKFAHIVTDTPARPRNKNLRELVRESELVVVPTAPDPLSLRALLKTVEALREFLVPFYALITLIPPPPSKDGSEARKTLLEAGVPTLRSEVRRWAAFNRAALAGTTVREVRGDPRAPLAWLEYEAVGRELEWLTQG